MSFSKTPAELSETRAPTSSAQRPTIGQPYHHHHHHHPQYHMTPAQVRQVSYASVAAPSGSPQIVVPSSSLSTQPPRRSGAPRSKPADMFTTYHAPVPINIAPLQPMTGGVGASRDPRLRKANVQTATPPIPALPTPSSVSLGPSRSNERENTVTDTPIFPTPSLEVMETMAEPKRRKRSSNEATGETKRYCGTRSPPLDNLSGMMSPNIRSAMTDPAPNESRTKESTERKYVGSSKTPAKSSKSRAPTSSAQPPRTGQSHSQYQMTPAQGRPASYSCIATPIGSPQPIVPPSVVEHLAVPTAKKKIIKNSDPSMQQARRSESPRSESVATYRTNVGPASRQLMTAGVGASRDPRLCSANAQTMTPPVPASPAPPRAAAYDSSAPLTAYSYARSNVSPGPSRSDVTVNTATDTPMLPTPSLENMETMARPQWRKRSSNEATGETKRYCGTRSPPLDNLSGMMSPNIRAAMTDPAPNESRTKESKERKYVGSSKTPAMSSKSRAPTSSAQPPRTSQSHSQYQMTPAQGRPASYSCIATPIGSPQPIVPPSVVEHLAVPTAKKKIIKNSDPSMQQARRSESPRSESVATYRTNVGPASRQLMTGGVGASRDPRLCSANAQTMTPPVPASPVPPRAAAYDSSAPLTAYSYARSNVSPGPSRSDVTVNTATDTPMLPTPSLKNMETMARPQWRKRSSDEATGEVKRYCGSRSPPLDNQNMASVAAPSGSPQPDVPPSVAADLTVPPPPTRKNSDSSVQQARRSESPRSVPVATFATYRTYEIPAPHQSMTGGVGESCDPRLCSANAQTMTPPVPASPVPPRAAAYDSSAPLTVCSCAGSNVSPGPSRSDVTVNTTTDTPMIPTPSLENMKTMARPQQRKWSSDETTGEAKWYCCSRFPLQDNLNRSMSLPNIRVAMTGPAQNESRIMEPKEGQCVGSSTTPAESSKPQAPTSSAQPPTTGQPHPQHQMTPAQARPASSASVVAPSDSHSPPLDNLKTMDNAGVSCVAPGPQDYEFLRKLLNVGSTLAEAIRSEAVAYASRIASSPQDSELSSRKMMDLVFQSMVVANASHAASGSQDLEFSRKILDLVSILAETFQSMTVVNASRAASGINQFTQTPELVSPYSESNPSEPKKDEKNPLKTKKKPNKKVLHKKITKRMADLKIFRKEMKEINMLETRDKAEKRLERRKTLMERDQEIIKRVDENLKQPTDQRHCLTSSRY